MNASRRFSLQGRRSLSTIVFDRELKKQQRKWAVSIENSDDYNYLRREVAERLVDRLDDITRDFEQAMDISCHTGHIYDSINSKNFAGGRGVGGIKNLLQCDMSNFKDIIESKSKGGSIDTSFLELDEENIKFDENSFDLIMSSMSMHWVNDVPKVLSQIKKMLKPDGVFICSMLGGSTLEELKYCFYLADIERKGGISPHTSPYMRSSDAAALIQGAGFMLPTIDVDTIHISYPNAFVLMEHLQGMGENGSALNRQYNVGRDTMLAMASAYQSEYCI